MDHEAQAEALAAQLNGVRRVLRRRVRAGLDVPALTGSQVELLRLVESAPGIGVSAAAQQLHLAGNSVSTLVNQLTEAALLRRERDTADRRSARLYLTPAAVSRLTAWRAARVSALAGALSSLDAADRDALAAVIPVLSRLAEALAAGSASSTAGGALSPPTDGLAPLAPATVPSTAASAPLEAATVSSVGAAGAVAASAPLAPVTDSPAAAADPLATGPSARAAERACPSFLGNEAHRDVGHTRHAAPKQEQPQETAPGRGHGRDAVPGQKRVRDEGPGPAWPPEARELGESGARGGAT